MCRDVFAVFFVQFFGIDNNLGLNNQLNSRSIMGETKILKVTLLESIVHDFFSNILKIGSIDTRYMI
jgi:hypothetical protein